MIICMYDVLNNVYLSMVVQISYAKPLQNLTFAQVHVNMHGTSSVTSPAYAIDEIDGNQ